MRAQVIASSETEAWCAGAIDTAYSFVRSHKLWYNWFVSAPGWLLFILVNVPGLLSLYKPLSPPVAWGWSFAFIALLLLYFGREKVLPAAVIQVSPSYGFFRNHIPELSLVAAVIAIIIKVVGWFIPKQKLNFSLS